MTPEQKEEIGMTMALMEADLLHTKKELAEAQQTIARQREALEFYAKPEHWELSQFGRGHSRITSDRGSKARELIGETQP